MEVSKENLLITNTRILEFEIRKIKIIIQTSKNYHSENLNTAKIVLSFPGGFESFNFIIQTVIDS